MMLYNHYVGIPFVKKGRSIEEGFDCWGFFSFFYEKELGIKIPKDYFFTPMEQTKEIVDSFIEATSSLDWVKVDKPEEGCAVALSKRKHIHHIGVWVSGGCLHSVEGLGVVFNTISDLKRNGYTRIEFYRYAKTTN